MKKIIFLFLILIFINIPTKIYAIDISSGLLEEQAKKFGINDFIQETKKYSGDFFDDINISEIFKSTLKGNIDNKTIFQTVLNLIIRQTSSSLKTLTAILTIVLIHSILKIITDNLKVNDVSNIIYYVEYILIISLIIGNFADIINTVKTTTTNLIGFMNLLIPILSALMLYTGSITTISLLEPIILFIVTFIGNIISTLILPIVSIIAALAIISKISDGVQISKITSFLKSSMSWALGIILTLFVGVISLEGNLTSSIDGITAKTAKAAISSLIPVVGKILGDSVDSVLGCGVVLKNSLGIVGVIIVIGICIIPIIKMATLSIMYSITSAIIEPISDTKIVKLLEEMSGIFKLLLAIICSISVLFIIGITLAIKISNTGMMYR